MHGNLPALEAVLARLERDGVDVWVCAGDLVGYGPFPNECVARIADLGAVCVAGNHDLMALGHLAETAAPPLVRDSLAWTRAVLDDRARAYLADLPLLAPAAGGRVLVAHGSPGDPSEYVTDAHGARGALTRMRAEQPAADLLVLGHTHRPLAFAAGRGRLRAGADGTVRLPRGERILLNPGSVGQSRERRSVARALVADLAGATVTFHDVVYDVQATRRALVAVGLPEGAVHVPPTARSAVRARLAAVVRGVRGP